MPDLSCCKNLLEKIPKSYFSVLIISGLISIAIFAAVMLYILPGGNSFRDKTIDQAGIPFTSFWETLQKESNGFLQGTSLYIAEIESVNVANFNKQGGRAGLWSATIVRCGQFLGQTEASESAQLLCVGDAAKVTMADPELTGMENTLSVAIEEKPFSGLVAKASDILISAEQAENIANKAQQYTANPFDDYYYKLTIDPLNSRPVWNISKTCVSKEDATCPANADWFARVEAGTGTPL